MKIIGKNLSVVLDLGDGRKYRLDQGVVTKIDISEQHDIMTFDMNILGPQMVVSPSLTDINIQGILTSSLLDDLFSYEPNEKKIKASGIQHGIDYCRYCGSDWIPDKRGNCGACGGPKYA